MNDLEVLKTIQGLKLTISPGPALDIIIQSKYEQLKRDHGIITEENIKDVFKDIIKATPPNYKGIECFSNEIPKVEQDLKNIPRGLHYDIIYGAEAYKTK